MRVSEVVTTRERERFIRYPWALYRNDPCWVPPLRADVRALVDTRRNPFFEHAELKLFLAADDAGAPRGRIAAVVNRHHNAQHNDRTGFFGLFECADDPAAAAALFDAAAGFLRARGLTVMRGPANLSVNDTIGLLTEGFDTPPAIMTPHNPPYYRGLVEGAGFRTAMELYAYYGDARELTIPDRVLRGLELCQRRYKFQVRPLDLQRFDAELDRLYRVYTEAWEQNWGAVAMTRKEFDHLARELKPVLDPDLLLIAEVNGEIAGFSLALPDFNQALIKINGRLFPCGLVKLLWYRRRIDMIRILTMGVLKRFRHMGIDNYFYVDTWRRSVAKGMPRGEMSWILATNAAMNNALRNLGFRIYKRYRLYDRDL